MFELHHAPISTASQRVERKYPLPASMLDVAVAELCTVLPIYRYAGTHDWSSLRTTYLDTDDMQCYREYLQNLPVRRKIRIRQYGVNGHFEDVCWVELKVKNRNISLKRRFCCLTSDLPLLMEGKDILDRVMSQNETDVSRTYHLIRSMLLEQRLTPTVRVDYERMSFQPDDGDGPRLTLDRNVRFCSASLRHRGSLEGLIVEVKHDGTKPPWFTGLREELGLRRARRFSKFARSVRQVIELRENEEPQ